jgi:hypothetical protein
MKKTKSKSQNTKKTKKQSWPNGAPLPAFCLRDHEWIPHEWLEDFPKDTNLKDIVLIDGGPGRYALIRIFKREEVLPNPTESIEAIHGWTPERSEKESQSFYESDRELTANLFVHATVSNGAVNCLADKAAIMLNRVFKLAEQGNIRAADRLAQIVCRWCDKMNNLARSKPELFRPRARQCWKWPVMKSLHPGLSDDDELILKNLELGKETHLELDKSARWKLDEAAEHASSLLFYIFQVRKIHFYQDKYTAWLTKAARALPEFNDDSAPHWWELAREILLAIYPEPHKVSELAKLVTAKSHRKSGGRMKARILEILEKRFKAFAKPAPYQT